MSRALTRAPIGQNVHFSAVTDPKFKANRISVNFVAPLARETASDNAVVPFILRRGCRELPDFTSLNARLAELYGASLEADVTKYGGYQILEIAMRFLDNRFALEGEDITAACAGLLASVALDPKLDGNGAFFAEDTALERQFIVDTIAALINEKRGYAVSQCVQKMCEGEPVAVRRWGYTETAERITPESATMAYRRLLRGSPVEIVFTGSGDPEPARRVFRERFAAVERTSTGGYESVKLRPSAARVTEHTETMELSQSKLVMGLRCGAPESQDDILAARVFASLFGGTPFSKLFLNVREKLQLCYYCASSFDVSTKLLIVDSGIERENKQKAQDEILRQLAAVQRGEFTDDELANTKLLRKNAIITTNDSLTAIEGWYMTQILSGRNISPEQDAALIDGVTREQVIAAAKNITLDTVYFLTGEEKGDA